MAQPWFNTGYDSSILRNSSFCQRFDQCIFPSENMDLISSWMGQIGLGAYVKNFEEEEILNGSELITDCNYFEVRTVSVKSAN